MQSAASCIPSRRFLRTTKRNRLIPLKFHFSSRRRFQAASQKCSEFLKARIYSENPYSSDRLFGSTERSAGSVPELPLPQLSSGLSGLRGSQNRRSGGCGQERSPPPH